MKHLALPLCLLAGLAAAPAPAQTAPDAGDPSLDAVFDSAALVTALAELPPRPPESRATFYVHFGPEGALDSISAQKGLLPRYVDSVTALLRRHVRSGLANVAGRGFGVRVHGGPAPAVTIYGLSVQRIPELLNPSLIRNELDRITSRIRRDRAERAQALRGGASAPGHAAQPRLHQATLRFRIDEEGRVGPVELERSSGDPELDRALVRMARRLRFRPGEVDGTPVAAWSVLPIQTYL